MRRQLVATRSVIALLFVTSLSAAACGDGEPTIDRLFLEITSEATASGQPLDALRILLVQGEARYPAAADEPAFNPSLDGLDPTARALLIGVAYEGGTFAGPVVTVQVQGLVAGAPAALFEGPIDLSARAIVPVHLRALPSGCDADGDGFLDCGVAGCCPFGDSAFADCEPADASANPWATVPDCLPCGPPLDINCDGAVNVCVDEDGDGIADCLEVDCGLGDPTVGPGLPELCDGKDNSCDGVTDGAFLPGGEVSLQGARYAGDDGKGLGEPCGVGACAGGQVVCDPEDPMRLRCSTDHLATDEVCDGVDNDCDGETDEGLTYEGAAVGAACVGVGECGAGIVECDAIEEVPICSTNPGGSESQATPETCDGLDNDCDGVIDNDVPPETALPTCRQEGVCGTHAELVQAACVVGGAGEWVCDYSQVPGYEEGVELSCDGLDNNCDGETDEGFTYESPTWEGDLGKALGDACGAGPCAGGTVVCRADATGVTCDSLVLAEEERCDGIDNDCDGVVDGPFRDPAQHTYSDPLYAADSGLAWGDACGTGACAGGTVVCNAAGDGLDCDTVALHRAEEVCDGIDNNCDGQTDGPFLDPDLFTYTDPLYAPDTDLAWGESCGVGVCVGGTVGCAASADALACDTVEALRAVELCDDLDNSCDGVVDGPFLPGGEVAYDGGPWVGGEDAGRGKGEACGTGVCAGGVVTCDPADPAALTCSTLGQAGVEVCDGVDNDCDGETDEGFVYDDPLFAADLGKALGAPCGVGVCAGGTVVCTADGAGAACSTRSLANPWEVCDDCLDDACDGTADGDGCVERRAIGVLAFEEGVDAGFAVSLTFDHADQVARGRSSPSGDDVRITWQDPASGELTEIDLVLDPASEWNTAATMIWFPLQAPVGAGAQALGYSLWFGIDGAPTMRDPDAIFHFIDLFDRSGDTLGEGWTEVEANSGDIALGPSGGLWFQNPRDTIFRPYAEVDLPAALVSGAWQWRLGFDWTRGGETTYRLLMQLGNGAAMTSPSATDHNAFPRAGVGPSLVWGGPTTGFTQHQELAAEVAGAITPLGVVSGFQDIAVRIVFGSPAPRYSVFHGQANPFAAPSNEFTSAQTSLDRIRLISDRISATGMGGRLFHYVIVRRTVSSGFEPIALLGLREPTACVLTTDGLVARYHLDDPLDEPEGFDTEVIKDVSPSGADMARFADGADAPTWLDIGGNLALFWANGATTGRAGAFYPDQPALLAGVTGTTSATLEVVIQGFGANPGAHIFGYESVNIGTNAGSRRLSLVATATGVELRYNSDQLGGTWILDALGPSMDRQVLHLVYQTTPGTSDRARLYRNGVLVPRVGDTQPGNNVGLSLGTTGGLLIGNRGWNPSAPYAGLIHYAAVYSKALSQDEITQNARVLRRDTDRRLED